MRACRSWHCAFLHSGPQQLKDKAAWPGAKTSRSIAFCSRASQTPAHHILLTFRVLHDTLECKAVAKQRCRSLFAPFPESETQAGTLQLRAPPAKFHSLIPKAHRSPQATPKRLLSKLMKFLKAHDEYGNLLETDLLMLLEEHSAGRPCLATNLV